MIHPLRTEIKKVVTHRNRNNDDMFAVNDGDIPKTRPVVVEGGSVPSIYSSKHITPNNIRATRETSRFSRHS
jgi:hypothetical protein